MDEAARGPTDADIELGMLRNRCRLQEEAIARLNDEIRRMITLFGEAPPSPGDELAAVRKERDLLRAEVDTLKAELSAALVRLDNEDRAHAEAKAALQSARQAQVGPADPAPQWSPDWPDGYDLAACQKAIESLVAAFEAAAKSADARFAEVSGRLEDLDRMHEADVEELDRRLDEVTRRLDKLNAI
jgi:hypothetical protein